MTAAVLSTYGFREEETRIIPFGTGLINHTWKVESSGKAYILQRINETVFKHPGDIAFNIRLLADYLHSHYPDYLFAGPLQSLNGDDMVYLKGEGFFRLFPFIGGSHTVDVVQSPVQAYEAARQFGRFTKLLSGFDSTALKITIPGFHDLSRRYQQFTDALQYGNTERIKESKNLIAAITGNAIILKRYEALKTDPSFRLRVTHHDTKISNVLFDSRDKGLCVIDLDTVMPGYFISDVGDMMRTYLSPVSEEEIDLNLIEVRGDFYTAIVQGYQDEMKDELTVTEKTCFFYAGQFMIYMQALRFLTDYLNDDIYYGTKYPEHNRVRAGNQLRLLEKLMETGNG